MNNGQHHLHIRKRIYKNLEQFPSPNLFKRVLDRVMFCVGILAPLALLPQVIQLFGSKNAAGLSLTTWVLLGGVNFLWALYGAVHRESPIFIANLLMGTLNFVVVVGILLYR